MVCISCILIPLALFIWHRFLGPFLTKFFPSWAPSVEKKVDAMSCPEGVTCPFVKKGESNGTTSSSNSSNPHAEGKEKREMAVGGDKKMD